MVPLEGRGIEMDSMETLIQSITDRLRALRNAKTWYIKYRSGIKMSLFPTPKTPWTRDFHRRRV